MRTLGCYVLALQTQGGEIVAGALGNDVVRLVLRSSRTAQIVLVILLLFSITSWAVIFFKLWQFRRAARESESFLRVFRRSSKFSEVQAVCRSLAGSPLVGLFQAGYTELNGQLRSVPSPGAGSSSGGVVSHTTLKSLNAVDRALLRASSVELNKLERRVPFLATTASITPFIGLFGTVWGIMSAFEGIGQTGSTNLGIVAPGIAEALIATAAGLFAAIPAVYFYNHLTNRVKLFVAEMDDFSLEFLNITERSFT